MEPTYSRASVQYYLERYYQLDNPLSHQGADSEGRFWRRLHQRNAPWEAGVCIKVDLDQAISQLGEPGRSVLTFLYLVGYEEHEVAAYYNVPLYQVHRWRKQAILELVNLLNEG